MPAFNDGAAGFFSNPFHSSSRRSSNRPSSSASSSRHSPSSSPSSSSLSSSSSRRSLVDTERAPLLGGSTVNSPTGTVNRSDRIRSQRSLTGDATQDSQSPHSSRAGAQDIDKRSRTNNEDRKFKSKEKEKERRSERVVFNSSSDESQFFDFIMEKVKSSKVAHWASKLAVESEPGLTNAQLMLHNHDLKPVEPERRQWGAWNFVGFWISDSFNINTWMISSSMIVAGGLSWWQSWLCVWIGYTIAACFICLTGRIGATYHISFPVVVRSSFGIWGGLWPVFNRAAMACVWYGVQSWIGGECVHLMISAIWPSFKDMKNGITGSGTTSDKFLSFFIFWLISLPAIWFPVHKIRHLFTVKAFVVPTAGVCFFIWAVVRAKGIGPIVKQKAEASGSRLAWGMITGIMSSIANFATLIVNDPDFARFARKPSDAFLPQLLTIPCGFAITSFIGIIVSSSSTVIFHTAPIWDPLKLLQSFLDEGTSKNRAGVFFIASAFCLAQLGTNIAANSVSAGTDMTALLPRYLNIRRGGYICAIVGLVMCPWNLLSSANNFTTYLSAYSVFLSSIAGVMIADYYLVRRGYLEIRELYSAKRTSPYYFTYGVHLKGYVAYVAGILINIVGFVGAIGKDVPKGATYIYNLNFFCGFIVSSGTYYLLCRLFPVPATSDVWMEVGDEITDVSVAYANEGSEYDEERGHASGDEGKGFKDGGVIDISQKRDLDV